MFKFLLNSTLSYKEILENELLNSFENGCSTFWQGAHGF